MAEWYLVFNLGTLLVCLWKSRVVLEICDSLVRLYMKRDAQQGCGWCEWQAGRQGVYPRGWTAEQRAILLEEDRWVSGND